MKRAFTLIELLVVIAIIAILAAILFPVFAQAKLAAKATASLSNVKQLTTASMIYSGDNDDMQMLSATINDLGAPADNMQPWSYILLPYNKSVKMYQDPLLGGQGDKSGAYGNIENLEYTYSTQFSYASQIHSPIVYYGGGLSGLRETPLSQTTLANPANTIFLTPKRRITEGPQWWFGAGWGFDNYWGAGIPRCSGGYTGVNPQALCGPGLNSWGIGSVSSWTNTKIEDGSLTGAVAFRKSGRGVFAYADGHAGTLAPGQAAAGTNYAPTLNQSALVITDITKYMWDAD